MIASLQSACTLMAAAASRAVRPRSLLTVIQWADKHRVLTSKGSGEVDKITIVADRKKWAAVIQEAGLRAD